MNFIRSSFLFGYIFFLLVFVTTDLQSQELIRPCIWVKPNDRAQILDKIKNQDWAKKIVADFMTRLDSSIALHQSSPSEFLKGMPFDSDKSKPGEMPPFFLTYHIENGQQRNLDNGTKEEMANARKLIRYLETGIDCGMAYYLTEDEKYAQCAIDILNAFVNGVQLSEVSPWTERGGWLFPYDGFREVREIGDKVPIIYDFTASYIKNGGKPFDFVKNAKTDFPISVAQKVFRTYANVSVNYGQAGSNHSVLQAPCLVYSALAMDDENERNQLLSHFLTKSTKNQDALNIMVSNFKKEGDLWPETSQYLNAVGSILTRLMLVVEKYNPSLRLGEKYLNVLFSLPALDYMVYPNNEIIRWGDGKRHGSPSYSSYEEAYLLGKMDGIEKITQTFGPLLNTAFEEGKYKRSGMHAVLWYGGEIMGERNSVILPRTDQVPHAGIVLQRNVSSTNNPDDGMMCFVGGAGMVHGHAEGMNIELYGRGQVLDVDNGRGNYQKDIHENYSRIFAAHNTVIVNGSSQGGDGWVNLGINTVQLKTMEPLPAKGAVSPNFSFSKTTFVDDKGDKAEATQERTLALVRTSETTGYYVDVFRSKSALPNEYHDYLYHNIGDELQFLNKDLTLKGDSERYQANAKGRWAQNQEFRNPGWHYFENVKTSPVYSGDVQAQFKAEKLKDGPIAMRLFIPGSEQREYTKVMAPHTFEAPSPYDKMPTPTLVIRKNGEAWTSPFVVVYEPFNGKETNGTIQSVTKLEQNGVFKGLKIVSKLKEGTISQFILVQSSNELFTDKNSGIVFQGEFGLITLDSSNKLQNMYLGDGKKLSYGKIEFFSVSGKPVGGFVDFSGVAPSIKVNGKMSLTLADGTTLIN